MILFIALFESLALQASVASSSDPNFDFDGSGIVDFPDFVLFASHFGTSQGDGRYEAKYDLDADGAIGFVDFVIFAGNFGKAVSTSTRGICDRTPQVRDAILKLLPVDDCALVTEAHLSSITSLDLENRGRPIRALQGVDFSGLSSLRDLSLHNNSLSTLPEGVFSGLSSLQNLPLYNNSLSTLPEGRVFRPVQLAEPIALQQLFEHAA